MHSFQGTTCLESHGGLRAYSKNDLECCRRVAPSTVHQPSPSPAVPIPGRTPPFRHLCAHRVAGRGERAFRGRRGRQSVVVVLQPKIVNPYFRHADTIAPRCTGKRDTMGTRRSDAVMSAQRRPRTSRPTAFSASRRLEPMGMIGSTILRSTLPSPIARSCRVFGSAPICGAVACTTFLSSRS